MPTDCSKRSLGHWTRWHPGSIRLRARLRSDQTLGYVEPLYVCSEVGWTPGLPTDASRAREQRDNAKSPALPTNAVVQRDSRSWAKSARCYGL